LPKFGSAGKFGVSLNEYTPKVNLRKSVFLIVPAIVLMGLVGWLLTRENIYQMFIKCYPYISASAKNSKNIARLLLF
jgi:hypothetical protein